MAKNYKETTTQAAVLRTSTKTLSFWCNIREAPLERFAELIEGNIRIALQDFSGGKGDKSKFAYFNLEISDIYEIKDCMQAKNPFSLRKSMANTQKQVVSSTECASPSILRCSAQKKLKMEN
mgnify:CR=1 FL=1